jgi:hypothetical protein
MRRVLLLIAGLAAAALPASAAAAPLPARVKVTKCSVERHEAVFYGRMKQVPGTARMAMRFALFQETGDGRPRRVTAPGLSRWHRSKEGVKVFGYRQGFRNLPENASHRVRVEFRWYDADGEELARRTRRSGRCRQFVELPNLVADLRAVRPTDHPRVFRYRAVVTNTGKARARLVPVRLTVDGKLVDTRVIASFGAGERRTLVFQGPACKRVAKLEADPERTIAETSDADNADELAC